MKNSISNKIIFWLNNIDSNSKKIARSMIAVGSFIFLSKTFGAFKEMAIAWRYGVSETVDAYLFVLSLVLWPIGIWYSVISAVIIPLDAKFRENNNDKLKRFHGELLGATILFGIVITVIMWFGFPWLLKQSFIGFNLKSVGLSLRIASVLIWIVPIAFVSRLFSTGIMSNGRMVNSLFEGSIPLAILLFVLFIDSGINPLIWGTFLGFVIEIFLSFTFLRKIGGVNGLYMHFRSEYWQQFLTGFGIIFLGQSLLSFTSIIDQFFASNLGVGALSYLGYTNRILSLVLAIGATTIGRSMLPVLSKAYYDGSSKIGKLVLSWSGFLFILGLVVATLGMYLSPQIVEIIFQRGAFTSTDTMYVAGLLQYGFTQVPFYFVSMILIQTLLSQSLVRSVALISGINLLVKLASAWFLVPSMGLNGLLLSTSAMYVVSMIFSLIVFLKRLRSKTNFL